MKCILFGIPFNIGVFFLPLVCLARWQKSAKKDKKINKNPCVRACVRVTPPPIAFACNVGIFFSEIVSYMSYGASLWDRRARNYPAWERFSILRTVNLGGYGVFPGGLHSDCTHQFLFCQQNNYFLDVIMLSHYY